MINKHNINYETIEEIRQKGKYIKGVDGNKIWYRYDKAGGIPTLFIHGLGGTSHPFEKFHRYFANRSKSSLLIDQRGHGFSEKPKNSVYEMSHFAQDINKILLKEKIKKINIVGHCFGGMVAMKFLELYPKKVNTITLISTNHKPSEEIKDKIIKGTLIILDEFLPHLNPHLYFVKNNFETDYSTFTKETDWYLPRVLCDFKDSSLEVITKVTENIFNEDFKNELPNYNIPCYLIHGKKDTVFSYKHSVEMNSLISGSNLLLLESDNHVTHIIDEATPIPKKIYMHLHPNQNSKKLSL